MSNDDLCTHLKQEVTNFLKLYDGKRQKNKFLALGIKLTGALFAAAITILLGIDYTDKPVHIFSNFALGLGALIAVLNTWDVFFNHKLLWLQFNNATIDMRLLQKDLEFAIVKNGKIEVDEANRFHNRLTAIIKKTNEEWQEIRREAEDGKASEPT